MNLRQKISFYFYNVFWGAFYALWVYSHGLKWMKLTGEWRFIEGLLILQGCLLGFFFIFRRPAARTSWNLWDVTTSFFGSFSTMLFISVNRGDPHLPGLIITTAGCLLTFGALISLNRSFGMLPAHRGIQTAGMYRWVRHPVYMSYLVFNTGYLLNHPDLYNILIGILCLLSQILRIIAEEKFLIADPAYQVYQEKVRWRLMPYIY